MTTKMIKEHTLNRLDIVKYQAPSMVLLEIYSEQPFLAGSGIDGQPEGYTFDEVLTDW